MLWSLLAISRASVIGEGVQVESVSATAQHYMPLYWAEKVSNHGLIKCKWSECKLAMIDFWWTNCFSMCSRTLWYVVECLPRAEKWSNGASQLYILTEVGQAYVHSWFDPVRMAKVLTGIHERSGFPGLKELFSACCQSLSCEPFTNGHFWCHRHRCVPWHWKCGFWCTNAILLTFCITLLCYIVLM